MKYSQLKSMASEYAARGKALDRSLLEAKKRALQRRGDIAARYHRNSSLACAAGSRRFCVDEPCRGDRMKAVICAGAGDASVMQIGEAPAPQLGDGQIRIAVRASGVNRADILQRRGHLSAASRRKRYSRAGSGGRSARSRQARARLEARRSCHGPRGWWRLRGRGVADAKLALPLPANLSFDQGAAIPEAFITSALESVHAGPCDRAIDGLDSRRREWRRHGGHPDAPADRCQGFRDGGLGGKSGGHQRLGAKTINYRVQNFEEIVRQETEQRGVDVILDSIGTGYLGPNLRSLATDGRLIQIGLMGGRADQIDLGLVLSKRLQVIGSTLRSLPLPRKRSAVAAFRSQFLADFESGGFTAHHRPGVPGRISSRGTCDMEANRNIGKIVLQWTLGRWLSLGISSRGRPRVASGFRTRQRRARAV